MKWEGLGCLGLFAVGLGLVYLIALSGAWWMVAIPLAVVVCLVLAENGRSL